MFISFFNRHYSTHFPQQLLLPRKQQEQGLNKQHMQLLQLLGQNDKLFDRRVVSRPHLLHLLHCQALFLYD
jgi:hypothetical protein